jgi:hypothetical protein
MSLVSRFAPEPSLEERARGLLVARAYLHSFGITSWQDAIVGKYPTMPNTREVYPRPRPAATGRRA